MNQSRWSIVVRRPADMDHYVTEGWAADGSPELWPLTPGQLHRPVARTFATAVDADKFSCNVTRVHPDAYCLILLEPEPR